MEAEVHPFRRSTGPLEGQINRLKVIKRETAEPGLELLKARVLPLEPLPTC
jgi:transposase